jgi:hypothetical protein
MFPWLTHREILQSRCSGRLNKCFEQWKLGQLNIHLMSAFSSWLDARMPEGKSNAQLVAQFTSIGHINRLFGQVRLQVTRGVVIR